LSCVSAEFVLTVINKLERQTGMAGQCCVAYNVCYSTVLFAHQLLEPVVVLRKLLLGSCCCFRTVHSSCVLIAMYSRPSDCERMTVVLLARLTTCVSQRLHVLRCALINHYSKYGTAFDACSRISNMRCTHCSVNRYCAYIHYADGLCLHKHLEG
jgi:hypothetical protein